MLEEEMSGECAVLVVCGEAVDYGNAEDLLRRLYAVNNVAVIRVDAPEKAVRSDELRASLEETSAKYVALIAHSGCTKNSVPHEEQMAMLRESVGSLAEKHGEKTIVGIWLDEQGTPLKVELQF